VLSPGFKQQEMKIQSLPIFPNIVARLSQQATNSASNWFIFIYPVDLHEHGILLGCSVAVGYKYQEAANRRSFTDMLTLLLERMQFWQQPSGK
jgi:hypothetical protein